MTMRTAPPLGFGRPFNRADLARMPDDGRRPEVIDGMLIVTFVPGRMHQRAVASLASALDDACPPELEVVLGPFAVGLAEDTELRPDLLVARRAQLTEAGKYQQVADVTGEKEFDATLSYQVCVAAADLVR